MGLVDKAEGAKLRRTVAALTFLLSDALKDDEPLEDEETTQALRS